MFRQLAVTCGLWLVLSAGVVHAQAPDWGTWEAMLYDNNQGFVYTVNSANVGDRFQLPAPANAVEVIPRAVAVSRDGAQLAYMTYAAPRGNGVVSADPTDGTLAIYSRETGQLTAYPFRGIVQHALDYPAPPTVFSPDGTELALGYLQPDGWYIAILNLETQTYRRELLAAATTELAGAVRTYTLPVPVVFNYTGAVVEFVMVPAETIPTPDVLNSYAWNLATGAVLPTARATNLDFDLFPPTGETVQTVRSADFAANPAFTPHNHLLRAAAPPDLAAATAGGAVAETVPFYFTRQFNLFRPAFVADGTQVMFQANDTEGGVNWLTLPRAGGINFVTTPDDGSRLGIQDVAGTEYGALVLADSQLAAARFGVQTLGGLSVVHVDLRDPFTPLLEPVTSIDAPALAFIWARYERTGAAPAYPAWTAVTPDADPPTSPEAAPATLAVGATAEVFTTEGDPLNVRSAPGTGFSVVDELNAGAVVQLLEGPVEADGFLWWRVVTPRGVEGWTVQAADGVVTLLPTGAPTTGEAAPPPTPTAPPTLTLTPAPGEIFVGGQVVVQVAGLRLRAEPTTSAAVLGEYRPGAVLNVIGGPVEGEGFTWWQVQTPDVTATGWMVAAVGEDAALVAGP